MYKGPYGQSKFGPYRVTKKTTNKTKTIPVVPPVLLCFRFVFIRWQSSTNSLLYKGNSWLQILVSYRRAAIESR